MNYIDIIKEEIMILESPIDIKIEDKTWRLGDFFGHFDIISDLHYIIHWHVDSKEPLNNEHRDYIEELVYYSIY